MDVIEKLLLPRLQFTKKIVGRIKCRGKVMPTRRPSELQSDLRLRIQFRHPRRDLRFQFRWPWAWRRIARRVRSRLCAHPINAASQHCRSRFVSPLVGVHDYRFQIARARDAETNPPASSVYLERFFIKWLRVFSLRQDQLMCLQFEVHGFRAPRALECTRDATAKGQSPNMQQKSLAIAE